MKKLNRVQFLFLAGLVLVSACGQPNNNQQQQNNNYNNNNPYAVNAPTVGSPAQAAGIVPDNIRGLWRLVKMGAVPNDKAPAELIWPGAWVNLQLNDKTGVYTIFQPADHGYAACQWTQNINVAVVSNGSTTGNMLQLIPNGNPVGAPLNCNLAKPAYDNFYFKSMIGGYYTLNGGSLTLNSSSSIILFNR